MAKKQEKPKSMQKSAQKTEHHAHKSQGINQKTAAIIAAIVLIGLVLLLIFYSKIFPASDKAVAYVNGEPITEKELNEIYSKIPEIYKTIGLTEEKLLNDTLIPQKLLLQEAAKRGVTVTDAELQESINNVMSYSGITEEELKSQLKEQNITYDEFAKLTKDQLVISKLLNETLDEVNITEKEAKDFYNQNKESFSLGNNTYASYSDMKERIISFLANKKFMSDLRAAAQIEIVGSGQATTATTTTTFKTNNEQICLDNGKPIIRMYSTTWCPHCKWIKETYDSVVKEYVDEGAITAYHWELDTYDNTLTKAVETSVPQAEMDIFTKNSPNGGVPVFVFGCKYVRIGNGYESENNLVSEETEFRQVIDSLLKEAKNG